MNEEKKYYMKKIRIPRDAMHKLNGLKTATGMSLSMICLRAIEQKYDVKLIPDEVEDHKSTLPPQK